MALLSHHRSVTCVIDLCLKCLSLFFFKVYYTLIFSAKSPFVTFAQPANLYTPIYYKLFASNIRVKKLIQKHANKNE